jgi:hypothetical protein
VADRAWDSNRFVETWIEFRGLILEQGVVVVSHHESLLLRKLGADNDAN